MDFLFPILLLALFAMFVSNRLLKERLRMLEHRMEVLEARRPEPAPPAAEPVESPPAAIAEPAESVTVTTCDWVPEPEPAEEEAPPRETLGGLFERLVAGRLLIWLGGVALVLAAIFLIRFSIVVGLITPAARWAGAGLFGLVLVGAG
jgi:uncharacterized membrane protein